MSSATESGKQFVRHALTIGALEIVPGGRELKSGRVSPYFFSTDIFSDGESLTYLASAYATRCEDLDHGAVVFVLAYKGIPLATAVALLLWQQCGLRIGYRFNRKEAKRHGDGGEIVGGSMQGKDVVVLDDVMTTGGSFEEAFTLVRLYGGNPIRCVIAFDRQERGIDTRRSAVQVFERKHRVPVYAGATLSDLVDVIREDGGHEFPLAFASLDEILAYREQYGVVV